MLIPEEAISVSCPHAVGHKGRADPSQNRKDEESKSLTLTFTLAFVMPLSDIEFQLACKERDFVQSGACPLSVEHL